MRHPHKVERASFSSLPIGPFAKHTMGRYRDVDALAYQQRVEGDDDGVAANHVSKKRLKAAGKVAEVVFDPEGHK